MPAARSPDRIPAAIPAPRQSVAWLVGNEPGSVSSHDREPRWLAVRAGYSRAPPTAIGRLSDRRLNRAGSGRSRRIWDIRLT